MCVLILIKRVSYSNPRRSHMFPCSNYKYMSCSNKKCVPTLIRNVFLLLSEKCLCFNQKYVKYVCPSLTNIINYLAGEGSPTVFWDFTGWNLIPQNSKRSPEHALLTPHSLQHLTPNVKLLLLLRNPVDR